MTGKETHRNPSTPGVQVSFSVYFFFCTPACLRTKVRALKSSRVVGDWLCQLQSKGSAVVSFHLDYKISSLPLAALTQGTRLMVNTQSVPAERSLLLNSCGEGGKGQIKFQIIRLILYGS